MSDIYPVKVTFDDAIPIIESKISNNIFYIKIS